MAFSKIGNYTPPERTFVPESEAGCRVHAVDGAILDEGIFRV